MKKIITLFVVFITLTLHAQTDGLSYQAVIINPTSQELPGADLSGNILPNTPITVRFTILDILQTAQYQETQSTVTDGYGMINLIVGQGAPTSGNEFTDINWDGVQKSLKVEINIDGTFTDLSNQVLTFLPYSFHRNIMATGNVSVRGDVDFNGNLIVEGTTELRNSLTVNNIAPTLLTGSLTVDGNTLLNSALDVANESPTNLTGKLIVDGFTALKDALEVEGPTSLENNLRVTEETELNGTLLVRGETTLENTLTVAEQSPTLLTGTLQVEGETNFNDDVSINNGSALSLSGELTVDGDTNLGGNLVVNGLTDLNSNLSVNNASPTTLSGVLKVFKETTLESSLQVFGPTNLEDVLNVNNQKPTNLSGSLTVDGETNLNSPLSVNNGSPVLLTGDLDVEGNTTLNNNLTVNGITNLNNSLFVNNMSPTTLSGTLDVTGATDLNDTLIVDGETTLNSNVSVANASATNLSGTLEVDGITSLNNMLEVTNGSSTNLTGTLEVDGVTNLNNDLNVTNNSATNLSGTLTVDGESTLNGNVTVANGSATSLTGTLDVDGQTTLNNGLAVTNASPSNLSGTLTVDGETTLNDAVTINAATTIDNNLTVTGNTTVGSLSTRTMTIESDEPGFVATFENTNNSTGDGIVIKLGRLHGAYNDGSIVADTGTDGLLELPNPIATDLQSGVDFLKNKFENPSPITFSDIQNLAPSATRLASINNLNNLVFDAFNDNLPNVSVPSIDFPNVPLLTGQTIFPGANIPFVNVSIPAWRFPELKIDGFNLLNPIPDLVPNLPVNLPTSGLQDIDFPVIALQDVANANSLSKQNKFISFQDKDGRQLGAIQAESLKDWKDRTICNPVYLQDLISKFVGIDALKDVAEGAAALTTAIDEYNNFGVAYMSGNGDYAEWLERVDPDEYISAGDIVAVKGGKITKNLEGLEQIMVVSHRPIVLGNAPDEGETHLGNNVAFMGQVPVKIMGPVQTGDYIVAGTEIKGYGKAVAPKDMTSEDFVKTVGRAWQDNSNDGPKVVNTVVGVHNGDWVKVIEKLKAKQRAYESKYSKLEAKVNQLDKLAEDLMNSTND